MQKTEILVLEIISAYTIEPIVRQVNDHKKLWTVFCALQFFSRKRLKR